ncbi:hypothetical protein B0T18DRAFT_486732 [Schizothecium vesticola]|uniref:Uncharacterized protein n=1 Tax=Schizothecium vesticola TaxID=314040 RepID=A0AA40F752_9PEZI|nr:hypothetical protein B0T18DRAFT_486732 [Schizothecium vesticola]
MAVMLGGRGSGHYSTGIKSFSQVPSPGFQTLSYIFKFSGKRRQIHSNSLLLLLLIIIYQTSATGLTYSSTQYQKDTKFLHRTLPRVLYNILHPLHRTVLNVVVRRVKQRRRGGGTKSIIAKSFTTMDRNQDIAGTSTHSTSRNLFGGCPEHRSAGSFARYDYSSNDPPHPRHFRSLLRHPALSLSGPARRTAATIGTSRDDRPNPAPRSHEQNRPAAANTSAPRALESSWWRQPQETASMDNPQQQQEAATATTICHGLEEMPPREPEHAPPTWQQIEIAAVWFPDRAAMPPHLRRATAAAWAVAGDPAREWYGLEAMPLRNEPDRTPMTWQQEEMMETWWPTEEAGGAAGEDGVGPGGRGERGLCPAAVVVAEGAGAGGGAGWKAQSLTI